MNTENPQSFILKAVKELAAISEESVINTSALCRLLEIDANNVRQRVFQTGCSTFEAIQYYCSKNNNKQQS
ncbi:MULTISPECIES: hypothetical protein [Escherichia]|jgi:hypothetical protein|uniref:Uncharacterized protein n=1 Tax=Escherichia coli TaxID=562 RepID=A0A1X0YY22_ECOLX|nr:MULTISPECIES: hypothetical protein [Escherichia]ESA69044.1 hypothetical protein HMPREF1591_00495 [Escherichia coli 113303]MDR3933599.1 hypothetical protein [Escherichia sp.]EES9826210.1 hypothetical protein [Escherichia coli]EEY6175643.1 hypothetical protein [Escherichia coli]EFA4650820.1 hypothetical protein [Escherichia coli]